MKRWTIAVPHLIEVAFMKKLRLLAVTVSIFFASELSALADCETFGGVSQFLVCHTRGDFYKAVKDALITDLGVETFENREAKVYPGGIQLSGGASVGASNFEGGSVTVRDSQGGRAAFVPPLFAIGVFTPGNVLGFDFMVDDSVPPPNNLEKVVRYNGQVITESPGGFIGVIDLRGFSVSLSIENFSREHSIGVDYIEYRGASPSAPSNPLPPRLCGHLVPFFAWCPVSAPQSSWYDPPTTTGYRFTTLEGKFTAIDDFPPGFSERFQVHAGGALLGQFGPGERVDFPGGVGEFTVSGITPAVDGSSPLAFPIKLSLDTVGVTFVMRPLTDDELAPKRLVGSGYNFPETPVYRATFSVDVTGGTSPVGSVRFSYSRTRLNFVSSGIDSMVVTNGVATVRGTGAVNGTAGYAFAATGTDGSPDTFSIEVRKPDGTLHFLAPSLPLSGGSLTLVP